MKGLTDKKSLINAKKDGFMAVLFRLMFLFI